MQSLFNVLQQLIDLLSLALFRKDDKSEVQLNTLMHSHTFKATESPPAITYLSTVMKCEKENPCPKLPKKPHPNSRTVDTSYVRQHKHVLSWLTHLK